MFKSFYGSQIYLTIGRFLNERGIV